MILLNHITRAKRLKYMKRYYLSIIHHSLFITLLMTAMSCSDFFDPESKSVIKTDEQSYSSELEARSGLFGLLQGLQQIGDNYVLMGELRGDLMTVTDNSSQELRDINNHDIDTTNNYLKKREYYSLINNCNYYIQHLDTAVTKLQTGKAVQILRPYMAQAKAIRAWTYLNLCLDYGYVEYTDKPLLSVDDHTSKRLTLESLADILITDLKTAKEWLPTWSSTTDAAGYSDPGFTSSVSYESYEAKQLLLPLDFVLGELYMWKQDFSNAVQCYYNLILHNQLRLCQYRNSYDSSGTIVSTQNWKNQFSNFNYIDILFAIVFSDEYADGKSALYTMANTDYTIAPSQALIDDFNACEYYDNNKTIIGDLRGLYGTYTLKSAVNGQQSSSDAQYPYISKYGYMMASSKYYISPCRGSLVWLRYAECLNRLGKPRIAFYGFMRFGLCAKQINYYKSYFGDELTDESWLDFGQKNEDGDIANVFKSNTLGFHSRGCGNTEMNITYAFKDGLADKQDSILWVEEQLVNEYALETAFEGNRFHDLMRISRYRNDNSFLAEKVASKFNNAEKNTIMTKLLDEHNWYLK